MFTGIITDIGRIARVTRTGDTRVVIETAYDTAGIDLGASIACSGVCLTVVDKAPGAFAVDVSGESIARTAPAMWVEGAALNLERAMRLGDELGGHIVTGHVDGIATVASVTPDGDSKRIAFALPLDLAPFVAAKGSVTIDGVSLTVNTVEDAEDGATFAVNVIPHTQGATTLGRLRQGDAVNVEIDVLARYLRRMEHYRAKA
ncbi:MULTISPECIES: riboflavin synthase [unclassified Sphingomonas]|uniref:riboflavin synthase n=1 Tax=unclassified Sphingomonas TaxID=196159 RepID=UPI00226A2B94|nr:MULTISPECIES: riboflavin synthase [unclassified Sphingomonas]